MNDSGPADPTDADDNRAPDPPDEADTLDADEGEPDVEAFAGDQDESPDAAAHAPREHGYGYE